MNPIPVINYQRDGELRRMKILEFKGLGSKRRHQQWKRRLWLEKALERMERYMAQKRMKPF